LTSKYIKAERERNGEHVWDIWRDGCPGGESPQQVMDRLDGLISDIRERFQRQVLEGKETKGDVLIVAHGHILRAFAMRWIGKKLTEGVALLLEAGGVGTLSYEHHSIDEPAILLGGAFMADIVNKT
jgi:broad specificity phosphatase PhoE